MIYETYTCAMADGTTEFGFCFKEKEGDDDCCTDAEIVVGVTKVITTENKKQQLAWMRRQWKNYMWMAEAIVKAAP